MVDTVDLGLGAATCGVASPDAIAAHVAREVFGPGPARPADDPVLRALARACQDLARAQGGHLDLLGDADGR